MHLFLPGKHPMALCTHLHTWSNSSTLSMGECVLCIRANFCFTLSTSRLSGTPVRTPRHSMAASPLRWSRFCMRCWVLPSLLCNSTRALLRCVFRGLSTQENMARSRARSVKRVNSTVFWPSLNWGVLVMTSLAGAEMCQEALARILFLILVSKLPKMKAGPLFQLQKMFL